MKGEQILAEFVGCKNKNTLEHTVILKDAMQRAALSGKATVVSEIFQQFSPHGISGIFIVKESHISVHTWPEDNYCAIDIFTCGKEMNIDKVLSTLKNIMGPESVKIKKIIYPFPEN